MRQYEHEANLFCKAIKAIAEKPDNLDIFESYLAIHFATWTEKAAYNPETITAELVSFAELII